MLPDRIVVRVGPKARTGIEALKAKLGIDSDIELVAVALRDLVAAGSSVRFDAPIYKPHEPEYREDLLTQLRVAEGDFILPAALRDDLLEFFSADRIEGEMEEIKKERDGFEAEVEAKNEELKALEAKVEEMEAILNPEGSPEVEDLSWTVVDRAPPPGPSRKKGKKR